jgi:ATP-dependent DNA helicase RecG
MTKVKSAPKLGRLSQVGISSLLEVALYLPSSLDDYTHQVSSFDPSLILPYAQIVILGELAFEPQTQWKNKRPMTKFVVTDGTFHCNFTVFGDTRKLLETYSKGAPICVCGVSQFYGGKLHLNHARIIDSQLAGKLVPVYKGNSGKITASSTYTLLQKHMMQSITEASDYIRSSLISIIPNEYDLAKILHYPTLDFEGLLYDLHFPHSHNSFDQALIVMKKISAFLAAQSLLTYREVVKTEAFSSTDYNTLVKGIPFSLTAEQKAVVGAMVKHVKAGKRLEALLIGDVGSGKTVVFGLLAAYFAFAHKRVAIILPNENLVRQIASELAEYFPWMDSAIVLGSSNDTTFSNNVLIGTTALLFRSVGEFSLVICDEQQKLSRGQREQLRGSRTHMIDVSATPLPRTLALSLYGAVDIYRLRHSHVEKTIYTRIWESDERKHMFSEVMKSVYNGNRVLVVCPKKEDTERDFTGLRTAEDVARKFELVCPNNVGLAHSGLSSEEINQAIDDIKSGKIQILVSTSIVEVGLTIPLLNRVVIISPDRFGLQNLHQIRGRVARQGGVGYCDLYLPKPLSNPDTYKRLQVLVDSTDGFKIAERDLEIRGTGDLSRGGNKQHGTPDQLIKNIPVSLKHIEWAVESFERLNIRRQE